MQVFDNIKVVDFTWGMAGSLATSVLSDFGAEVIKVEPPEGDPFRTFPGAIQWNRGKKSVVVNLNSTAGKADILKLIQNSDVVVESFRPGVAERLGVDYGHTKTQHDSLIYASLTGFGNSGPYANYKGYEGIVAAKSGRLMIFEGQHKRDGPSYGVVNVASFASAMSLVRGITTALFVRDRTGIGQKVETSLLHVLTAYEFTDWLMWQMMIKDPETYEPDHWVGGLPPITGYLAGRTRDGKWIQISSMADRLFRETLHYLELDWIFKDPVFKDAPRLDDEARHKLWDLMLQRISRKTLNEWMDIFINQTSNVAAEPFMNSEEGMQHPQMLHNGHVCSIQDPVLGCTRQLGPLITMDNTPSTPKRPSPQFGEDTKSVLGALNQERQKLFKPLQCVPKHPLDNIVILDLSSVIAGPQGCSMVAELGARVIHIENLDGDTLRNVRNGLPIHRTMAGAKGLCLDLKTSDGQKILHSLVSKADVLIHNMRPGADVRTGISYPALSNINPKLIYVYAAGYGSTGPHSHRPAFHPIPGAICGGAVAQMGMYGIPLPSQELSLDEIKEISRQLGRANDTNADVNASMVLSVAIVMGLYARERTGKGQFIESTMLSANAYANADDFYQHADKAKRKIPDHEGYGLHALYRLYKAKDGWVFLACLFEYEWQLFCDAVGRTDLYVDSRFSSDESRTTNNEALCADLTTIFATRDALTWEKLLTSVDVACVKVEDRSMVHFYDEDLHVRLNGYITQIEATGLGTLWRYSPLLHFSKTKSVTGPGPLKGEHTREILLDLGYDDAHIERLRAQNIVHW